MRKSQNAAFIVKRMIGEPHLGKYFLLVLLSIYMICFLCIVVKVKLPIFQLTNGPHTNHVSHTILEASHLAFIVVFNYVTHRSLKVIPLKLFYYQTFLETWHDMNIKKMQ